ncbi:RING finger and transmembrane domain-containing protein 1-like [Durio zibethinus]|uniref:RING finger and transmembrane domain-containing protein 1-like n=1 Tax=Durio zibethinus TaxID=66656 RepID=A0A6P6AJ64_DURZI|nr:RING finger and transmembrane domain-containing protein 1-like [Durio zibethinus]
MMETSPPISDPPSPSPSPSPAFSVTTTGGDDGIDSSRSYAIQLPSLNLFQLPLSLLLEYSGIFSSPTINQPHGVLLNTDFQPSPNPTSGAGEVSIRIIGPERGEEDNSQNPTSLHGVEEEEEEEEEDPLTSSSTSNDDRNSNSSYHYDVQRIARWFEHILPFSLLLLLVFIRQHLQGFVVMIWVTIVMFKSNVILQKQTALKGERKNAVLVTYSVLFMLHVIGVYWWYQNNDLLYPLVMLPPKTTPPFWHAIFIILVNDTMVRQAVMAFKCVPLIYYKNGKGHNFRRQGQVLTLVEYTLLLYRALLPTPVWYRFFLNKDYGSLFSSLTTGLYLTFKFTSVIEKVRSFYAALKALSQKEVHYGAYATLEQVNEAGDLCTICQEKMQAPILLRCKHIFCEDCVSEWFERERTCPLCRAVVKAADLQSFGDGSTSLFFQLF